MTTLEKVLFGLLFVAVIVLGVMLFNVNSKGKRLTAWAQESATWSEHVNTDHLATDHAAASLAKTHVPPPSDPPPKW